VLRELLGPRREGEQVWQVSGRVDVGEAFIIVRKTGMRPGEVLKLSKAQINFKHRVIFVNSKKGMSSKRSAKTREVPMPDGVLQIIERRFNEAKGEYLFPGDDPNKPRSAYHRVFKHACERASVVCGYNGLIFYDARRTAENEMLEAGHSPRAVGDIFGHSAETMVKHYARSTREQRRRAVESTGASGHELTTYAPDSPDAPDLPKEEKGAETTAGK
jgi:integrase